MKTKFLITSFWIILLFLFSCENKSQTGKKLSITVIPKGTTHVYWQSIHAGALKAAKELDIELIWIGPEKEDVRRASPSGLPVPTHLQWAGRRRWGSTRTWRRDEDLLAGDVGRKQPPFVSRGAFRCDESRRRRLRQRRPSVPSARLLFGLDRSDRDSDLPASISLRRVAPGRGRLPCLAPVGLPQVATALKV